MAVEKPPTICLTFPVGSQACWSQYPIDAEEIVIVPSDGAISPSITLARVDLPLPTGPEQVVTDPRRSTKLTSCKRISFVVGESTVTPSRRTAASVGWALGAPEDEDVTRRLSVRDGSSRYACILSKLADVATALGTIVIIMFAGSVTSAKMATVVNAVLTSSWEP